MTYQPPGSDRPPRTPSGPPGLPPYPGSPYGGRPPAPSGGRRKAGVITLCVVLAMVVLAGSIAGGWYFFGRGDGAAAADRDKAGDQVDDHGRGGAREKVRNTASPENSEPPKANLTGQLAWEHDWPKPNSLNTVTVGTWMLHDVVVVGRPDQVVAYNLDDGSRAWKAALPEGTYVCGMSRNTVGDIGGVALSATVELHGRETAACGEVMLLDTTDGTERSTAPTAASLFGNPPMEMTEAGLMYHATSETYLQPLDGSQAIRLNDGSVDGGSCSIVSFRASKRGEAIATERCGYDDDRSFRVVAISPRDGKRRWVSEPIRPRPEEHDLIIASVDPIVVASDGNDRDRLLNYDDDGALLSEIEAQRDVGQLALVAPKTAASVDHPDVDTSSMEAVDRVVMANEDLVYVRVANSGDRRSDGVVTAFERGSGQLRWKQTVKGQSNLMFAGVDRSGVVLLSKGTEPDFEGKGGTGAQVHHLASEDGARTPLGEPYADLTPPDDLWWMDAHTTWTGNAVVAVDLGVRERDEDSRFVYVLQ